MNKVSIIPPQERVTCTITLPLPLSSLMDLDRSYGWGELTRLRAVREDAIELDTAFPEEAALHRLLTGLQAGLLFAAVSGMRLHGEPIKGALTRLTSLGGRVDLSGPGRRSAVLALWADGVEVRQAFQLAERGGYAHLVLTRGAARTRPHLSVLVPERDADRAMGDLIAVQTLRLSPELLVEPDPELIAPPRVRPQRSAKSRAAPAPTESSTPESSTPEPAAPETPPAGAVWAVPFLSTLGGRDVPDPPLAELDALAADPVTRTRARTDAELLRSRIARALAGAWRLGADPERYRTDPAWLLQLRTANFLRERSRVVEEVTRSDPDTEPLHALIRVSALQAWRLGVGGAKQKPPPARFREECPVPLRSVSPELRRVLLGVHQGSSAPDADTAAPLIRFRFLDATLSLTRAGRRAVAEALSETSGRLPRLRDLLGPTRAAVRGLSPVTRKARPEPRKRAARDETAERSAAPARSGPGRDPDEIRTLLDGIGPPPLAPPDGDAPDPIVERMLQCWRVGRAPQGRVRDGVTGRVPAEVRLYLEERVRAVRDATGPDAGGEEAERGVLVLKETAREIWRLGTEFTGVTLPPLPARYRDEFSARMRRVPPEARVTLIDLHQGGPVSAQRRPVLFALVRDGLLQSAVSGLLTEAGDDLVRTELAHQGGDLPRILPGVPRTRPTPPVPDDREGPDRPASGPPALT